MIGFGATVRVVVLALALVLCASCADRAPDRPSATTDAAATPSPTSTPVTTSTAPGGDTSPIHDPALITDGDAWYVFSTGYVKREQGGTIRIATSRDQGATWASAGSVWDEIPAWIDQHYADQGSTPPDNLWAPEITEHDGTFYLYYSASTFGGNDSITALATNTTLDATDPAYKWVDRGAVITSPAKGLAGDPKLQFNAIDAGVIEDESGRPHLAIGSFWNGVFLVPISWPSGKPGKGWEANAVHLAERPDVEADPIEAPYVVRHGGYFYLFTSWDFCCRGADSTYKIAVGRSSSVTGPYVDQKGRALLDGGGTVVLETDGDHVGSGGQSVAGDTLAYHYYDGAADGVPTLGLATITWTDDWPSVDRPR